MADQTLKRTVDKILDRAETGIIERLRSSEAEAVAALDQAAGDLEHEYDRIISDGQKEAEKIQRQLVGSADLEARNRRLVLVEESVDRAFEKAVERIRGQSRDAGYEELMAALLEECSQALGMSDFVIHAGEQDKKMLEGLASKYSGATVSGEPIECLGGMRAVSRDGSMTFENTIDARLERMKPLIRKEIAAKFGLGN